MKKNNNLLLAWTQELEKLHGSATGLGGVHVVVWKKKKKLNSLIHPTVGKRLELQQLKMLIYNNLFT